MARVQVGYDPRAAALQTTAAPNIQTVQARTADPNSSKAFQLAAALGAPSVQQGLDVLGQKVQAETDRKESAAASKWANSMTVEALGKAIQDKQILPSQSPAFVAASSHIYGENALNQSANETISKMNRGELSFPDQASLEQHLVDERNRLLQGRDDYAVAGFDKRWAQVRESLLDANNKVLDKNFVEKSSQDASEAFRTVYDTVKREGGSPDDLVKQGLAKYELLKSTKVLLNPQMQKEALKGFALTMVGDGNQEALDKFLNSKLPNNGPTIRSLLGDQDALIIQKNAEAVVDKNARLEADNWLAGPRASASRGELNEEQFRKDVVKYEKVLGSATVQSLIDHNNSVVAGKYREIAKLDEDLLKSRENDLAVQQAEAAIAAGRPVMDLTVPSGRTIKAQDAGAAAMQKIIQQNPDIKPQEVIRRFAQGGIKNPEWERNITVALNNIGEVNIDATGKPVGQLLPATTEALDTFATVRQVSEAYARDMAGSERNYETMVHIQALRENGVGDPNLAAALVNQKNRRNIPPSVWGSIQKSVTAEVDQITNPGVFTGRFWGEVFRGEFGNGEKNLLVVKESVKKLAETYLSAGVAGDAAQAVEKAAQYYADPRVTTQINNTIYLNKDLPDLPQGLDRAKWFGKAMDGVVGGKLRELGIKYNNDDLVLIPQDGGNAPYMVSLRGVPTGMFVTKKELKSWVAAESDKEDAALVESLKPKKSGMGPDITFPPRNSNAPSIYAGPEEWKRYREQQKAK
jgi:hypothetical protein